MDNTFQVQGMTCGHCEMAVKKAIVRLDPEAKVEIDRTTGKVEVTAHNHGFAVKVDGGPEVDSPAGFGRVLVSHVSLNDNVVEGLQCLDIPAFSVQYHPEAAAGPHDSNYLFDRLVEVIESNKVAK